MSRETPYGAFNFVVKINGVIDDASKVIGGFSDVSGLGTELTVAEYRNGNEKENHVRKIPGCHKVSDCTLKRGIVNSKDFWEWINEVRAKGPEGRRPDVVITLRDEAGADKQTWTLQKVIPMKWTGPTLAAKGGGEVAMEELVLSAEGLTFD